MDNKKIINIKLKKPMEILHLFHRLTRGKHLLLTLIFGLKTLLHFNNLLIGFADLIMQLHHRFK